MKYMPTSKRLFLVNFIRNTCIWYEIVVLDSNLVDESPYETNKELKERRSI